MVNYKCTRCGYSTNLKGNIQKHLNRKTLCPPELSNVNPKNKIDEILKGTNEPVVKKQRKQTICKHCGKQYTRPDSRKRHEDKCSGKGLDKSDDSVEVLKELVKTLNKQNKKMEKLEELVKKAGISQNITNHNTQNITNNIVILPFKETDVSHLTGRDYYKALSRCVMSIPQMISDTHFNPKKPENHNIYISNLSRGHAMVYDGSKWILKNHNEVIDDLIAENEYRLEDWVRDGSKKYPKAMKKFEKYIEKRDERGVPELIHKEIKMMLYNNRTMIKESTNPDKSNCLIKEVDYVGRF